MKKLILLAVASLVLGGATFAQDTGALGIGLLAESGSKFDFKNHVRVDYFFDMGWKLVGPVHTGVELYGDVKKLGQDSVQWQESTLTDVFHLGTLDVYTFETSQWQKTVTYWDLDFSPRATVSIDVLDKAQIMGYLGLNYNWQTIDYTIKNVSDSTSASGWAVGEERTSSKSSDGTWTVVAGLRGTLDIFYVEYTRFLTENANGEYNLSEFSNSRFSAGLNFRF